jgi:hypothetical protein
MSNCIDMKNSSTGKLVLGIIATLAVTAGLFLFVSKQKSGNVVVGKVNADENTVMPSSGFDAYNDPALGISFQSPKDWGVATTRLGLDTGNENAFWRDVIGTAAIRDGGIEGYITVKKSNLSLDGFWKSAGLGITKNKKYLTVAGWPAILDELPLHESILGTAKSEWGTHKYLLVKAGNRFVLFEFLSSDSKKNIVEKNISFWEEMLSTLVIQKGF